MRRLGSTVSWLFPALVLLALFPPALSADAGTIDEFRQLALAPQGFPVAARSVKLNRLELELASGTVTPIVTASGERLGIYFEGDAKMLVRVTDPLARAVFAENARLADSSLAVGPDNVRDGFQRMALLSGEPVLEELVAGQGSVTTAEASRKAFSRMLAGMDRSDTGFDHLAAEARFDETGAQYVYAEFEGGPVRVGYVYDRTRFNSESLFTFVQPPGYDFRFKRRVVQQNLETSAVVPFTLERASFRIDTADNRSGTISSVLQLEIARDGIRILPFDLVNNRDPKSYAWTSDRNALKVTRVTDAAGRELPFSHRYHELIVDLGSAQKAGTKISLTVETAGEIFTGPRGERDDNYIDLNEVAWYPTPQGIAGRRFTFDLSMRTRKPFRPVTSGDTVSLKEEDSQFVLEAKSETPVWDVAVFAGKYKTQEVDVGGRKVLAHAYAMGREDDIRAVAEVAAMFLQIYEKMFGPYPFKELEVLEVPTFAFFGVSPPGVVILTSRTFQPSSVLMREYLGNKGVNALVAHELAHQWFGHKAWPMFPSEDNWLTESLSEYASGLAIAVAMQATKADAAKMTDFKEMLGIWRGYSKMADDKASIAGANLLGGDLADNYRYYLLYCRGPLVLHQLRTMIGDERYLAIMRKYLDGAAIGPVTTDDLAKAASEVLGQDMSWYFDQWVNEPGTPEIEVETRVEPAAAGGYQLAVRLTQPAGAAFKKIHVPLILEFAGGRKAVKLPFQEKPVQDFTYPLDAEPTKVLVDPGKNSLATYK